MTSKEAQDKITRRCNDLRDLLLAKNKQYGNSALDPVRIHSKASTIEQIKVRLDDKLSRIERGDDSLESDEEILRDIAGYYILWLVSLDENWHTSLITDNTTRGWLAGLLEGEGCFDLSRGSHGVPRIRVEMTDRDVVERAASVLGAQRPRQVPARSPSRKPTWRLAVQGERARQVMEIVLPLMGERRRTKIKELFDL